MVYISEGKTTYYVKGQRFVNDNGLRNGKKKAEDYCLSNFIPTNEIIVFDSMLECDRYEYLYKLQQEGKISNLQHHLSLPLLKEYINTNGDTIPELRYNADFVYNENGKNIVEDVKGASLFQDTRFEAIKQIFDYIYLNKTYIRIIIKRDGNWIEWKLGDSKKPRKLIQKQSQKIKDLKKQIHDKEMLENKLAREKARWIELKNANNLTSQQKNRLAELDKKFNNMLGDK